MLERLPVAWQGNARGNTRQPERDRPRVVTSTASVVSDREQSAVMSQQSQQSQQSEEQTAVLREEKEALLTAIYH